MSEFNAIGRLPRARIDPIATPYCALSMLIEVMDPTLRAETIVLLLDHERRGLSVFVVSGTDDPDSLLGVIDAITELASNHADLGGLIIGSVRPRGGAVATDLDLWDEADMLCEQSGVELVEWFVLGSSVSCPRELCGVPARWAA